MLEPGPYGFRVVGRITGVKKHCDVGHFVGQEIDLSGARVDGICGYLYHTIFPYLIMLRFGGGFPAAWGGDRDVVEVDCIDTENRVTIELRRLHEDAGSSADKVP